LNSPSDKSLLFRQPLLNPGGAQVLEIDKLFCGWQRRFLDMGRKKGVKRTVKDGTKKPELSLASVSHQFTDPFNQWIEL
jgi:hypothetical protein